MWESDDDADAYRALVGLNYADVDGEEQRAEAGDKITDMPENEAKHQTRLKHVEYWVPRQTENVRDDDEDVEVFGVESRHTDGGDGIKLKEADK